MDIRIAAAVVLGTIALGASVGAQDRAFAPRRVSASELRIPVPQATLDQQFQALKAMPSIEVEYSRLGNISRLQGQTRLFISATGRATSFDQPADEIIQKLRTVLVARGTEKLITRSSYQHSDGKLLSLKLGQTIRGLSVEGADVQLEIDTETGEVVSGSFLFVPDHGLATEPRIAAEEAFRVAAEAVQETHKAAKGAVTQPHAPVLKYQRPYRSGDVPRMIWEVYAAYPAQGGVDGGTVIVVIDAATGELRDMRTASVHAVNWPAWTAFNGTPSSASFPNALGSTTDSLASATWTNTAQADTAWGDYGLGRTPREIEIVVHYGQGWANAKAEVNFTRHWLFFGDGATSGDYQSGPLGASRDIAAHEYGHSRFKDLKPFNRYLAEPKAAEEFFADWSAVIVDNRWRATPSTPATWELGQIYTQSPPGAGLRSWTAPTNSWPKAGRDWYPDFRDYTDAHFNSTILGLAYRLMVTGGLHPRAGVGGIPPIDVNPGLGDATVKAIYIRALQGTNLSIDGDFMSIRRAVETAADAVIPTARATVEKAFDAVGIGYACAVPPGPPTLEVRDLLCNGKFVIRWPTVPGAIRYDLPVDFRTN